MSAKRRYEEQYEKNHAYSYQNYQHRFYHKFYGLEVRFSLIGKRRTRLIIAVFAFVAAGTTYLSSVDTADFRHIGNGRAVVVINDLFFFVFVLFLRHFHFIAARSVVQMARAEMPVFVLFVFGCDVFTYLHTFRTARVELTAFRRVGG